MFDEETLRSFYPPGDPVHGLDHVRRVVRLALELARREGANEQIVEAAAWLHDARPPEGNGGADERHQHQNGSAELAERLLRERGWSDDRIAAVQHCIRAHRFRSAEETPQTLEAKVLFDADKLDAIGAIGAARAIGYAARHGEPSYAPLSLSFLQNGVLEEDEPHSAFHEFVFKLIKLKDRLYTHTGRQVAEKRHEMMVQFFQRLHFECEGLDAEAVLFQETSEG